MKKTRYSEEQIARILRQTEWRKRGVNLRLAQAI